MAKTRNPFEKEPVLMQTVATAVTALVASLGLNLDAAATASLTTGVTALVSGFTRSKVTPEANIADKLASTPLGVPPAPSTPARPRGPLA